MKRTLNIILGILTAVSLSACGNTASDTASAGISEKAAVSEEAVQTDGSETESETETSSDTVSEETEAGGSGTAVVYFSATGNTADIAEKLADALSADIYEIIPAEPYSADDLDYNNDSCRANTEMNDDSARPAIENDLSDAAAHDTIFIGYSIWWGTSPKIINTFMETYDLSGKTVYTFCTSGGSGIGQSVSSLQSTYPEVNIIGGNRFGSDSSEDDIRTWLNEIGIQ